MRGSFASERTFPDIEEERRLFYVALTRAKDRLRRRCGSVSQEDRMFSRFIGEAGLRIQRSQSHCGRPPERVTIAENSSFLL